VAQPETSSGDTFVARLAHLERRLYDATAPMRALARPFARAGLRQRWDMFAHPQTHDHYVRLGYHIVSPNLSGRRIVLELVFPADREDRVRVLHAYQDKAVVMAFEAFFSARALKMGDAAANEKLLPLARYFTRRFGQTFLANNEQIVRTDVWYGSAPIPPASSPRGDPEVADRLEILRHYYDGPVSAITRSPEPPPLSSQEREADIEWGLASIDEP
jgi:hypothetical protein